MARKKPVSNFVLKPNTFYFIVPLTDCKFHETMVCKTQEPWDEWTDDWQKEDGYGFKVLGHVDSYEYVKDWPSNLWHFVEIPSP